MRIAFISTMDLHPWGGSESLWFETALIALNNGHSVATSTKWWKKLHPNIDKLEAARASIHLSNTPMNILHAIYSKVSTRIFNRDPVKADYKWLVPFKPEIIIISMGYQYFDHRFMSFIIKLGIPYILVIQAATEAAWPLDDQIGTFVSFYNQARRCLFVSNSNVMLVERQLGEKLKNTELIYNPFNVAFQCHLPFPASMDPIKLACVARLDAYFKGTDLLLELFNDTKWRNRNISLDFYGSGINGKSLRLLSKMYDLKNVSFKGHVSDIAEVWNQHHGLLLGSRTEGLPLAVVEAMLAARPVIATKVAGIPEVVEDNVTGFLAKAPTVELLDEAMERAWLRRSEWGAMGQLGQQRIRQYVPPNPAEYLLNKILDQSVSHETRT